MENKNVVAVNEALVSGGNVGAIVWWTLNGNVNYDALVAALKAAGLPETMIPAPISAETALRRAVKTQEQNRNDTQEDGILARPLGRGAGWALVSETLAQESDDLTYETICTVKLTDAEALDVSPFGAPRGIALQDAFLAAQGAFTPQDIGAWVVKIAEDLRALRLRERGGVYFVPSDALETWRSVAAALRSARGGHDLYEVPAMKSEEAVASILAALVREAEEEAASMREELTDGDLGGRALNGRAERCADIKAKVEHYESLLGTTQAALREKLDSLRQDLTVAALAAMGGNDAPSAAA